MGPAVSATRTVITRSVMLLAASLLPFAVCNAARPMVAAGNGHTLALHADGTVRAWGVDGDGQLGSGRAVTSFAPVRVTGMPSLKPGAASIAARTVYAMAIASDGSLWAWGTNSFGNLGDGTTTTRVTPVRVVGLTNVAAVTVGGGHSVAVTGDGGVWSWGFNHRGQLGDASIPSRSVPERVAGIANAVAVSAGSAHTVALLGDGTVWAWGDNSLGQIGDGTTTSRSTPVQVAGLSAVTRISAGPHYNLVLKADGSVWAWGYNDVGQIGDGTTTTRLTPVQVPGIVATRVASSGPVAVPVGSPSRSISYAARSDGTVWHWGAGNPGGPTQFMDYSDVVDIDAGDSFSVALRADGTVWTSGDNTRGRLGRPFISPRTGQVMGLPSVGAVAAGGSFVLAATVDGSLFSWGDNTAGQLGVEQALTRTTPIVTLSLDSATQVAAGTGGHSLALRSDGSVWAWGSNVFGALGNFVFSPSSVPMAVAGVSQMVQVSAGDNYSVALGSDGTVWNWGRNHLGELGRAVGGPPNSSGPPAMVPELSEIVKIWAGARHTVAVRRDGSVWTWGSNSDGQLGARSQENCTDTATGPVPCATRPIQVTGLSNVIDVAASVGHTLALRSDGTVWGWGDNRLGALGDGTFVSRQAPAPVAGLTGVVSIAAGGENCNNLPCGRAHSVALKSDGTVWTWGHNDRGQLGDGATNPRNVAKPVPGLAGIIAISAGNNYSVAVRSDGTVHTWGGNRGGPLGDGTVADRLAPVVVLREGGAGSFEGGDWFLDLDPAVGATVAVDKAFPMVVDGSVGEETASVSAQIGFRSADTGSVGGVFVFALAPASMVRNAVTDPAIPLSLKAKAEGKETPVQCVLAQLSSTGQLVGVSAASMQAYVVGVLSSSGQAVSILNGVPVATIGGATFYVGYGSSAAAMLNGGTNRSAATVPGEVRCQPQGPQTGWWWNPAEGGRGYSIEMHGNNIFFATFHYDVSGRSTWNVATGPVSLDGSLFSGDLLSVSGGQTLSGPYPGFPRVATAGALTLAFNDASQGTMIWPGGAVPIERFNIVPNGLSAAPRANQPESGWWWNPAESGRGFFIEWQDGTADVAGYMYDDAGNPVWYLAVYATPNIGVFSGNWWSYANGQTMMGTYRPATRINDNVAPVTIQFSAPDTAMMTLPGGRQIPLTRHRF